MLVRYEKYRVDEDIRLSRNRKMDAEGDFPAGVTEM